MTDTTLSQPAAAVGTRVRIVQPYPFYAEDLKAALVGRVGTVWMPKDSEGDIRVTKIEGDPLPDNAGENGYYYARQWEVLPAAPREFVKPDSRLATSDSIAGWADGVRVTVTGHASEAFIGNVGVTRTDDNGYALFEGGGTGGTLMNWTRLTEVVESNPVGPEPEVEAEPQVEVDPEVARLQVEVARLRQRENDLIDAMYAESASRQWGDALCTVLTAVGIPLRPTETKVHLDVRRRVPLYNHEFTDAARERLHLNDHPIQGYAEFRQRVVVTLPAPEVQSEEGCMCSDRHSLSDEQTETLRRLASEALGVRIDTDAVTVIAHRCNYCG